MVKRAFHSKKKMIVKRLESYKEKLIIKRELKRKMNNKKKNQ